MSYYRFRYPFQQQIWKRSLFRSARNRNSSWYGDLGNININGDRPTGNLVKALIFTGTVGN